MRRVNFRFEVIDSEVHPNVALVINPTKVGNLMHLDSDHYRFSQVLDSLVYYYRSNNILDEGLNFEKLDSNSDKPYIYPICVAYHPDDWTDTSNMMRGEIVIGKKSIFEHLPEKLLEDMRNEKALLLIDQSVEGYHTGWLWRWFHQKCEAYQIRPASIVYMTGDQASKDNYDKWCALKRYTGSRLKVIPSISLSHYLHRHYERYNMYIDFDDILEHKKNQYRGIYLYDCLNMRPRTQRVLNFLHLSNAGLLEYGNISMPPLHIWYDWITPDPVAFAKLLKNNCLPEDVLEKLPLGSLPRFPEYKSSVTIDHYYDYVERILDDLYRNSWVSIVTESTYGKGEDAVFLSEKTFKPIACMQPFITVGSTHSLKYLRQLGYKTFHPFIDESYDDEKEDGPRFLKIMSELKRILAIEDKVEWLNSMRDILEHNHRMFVTINQRKSIEHEKLFKYYFAYFKHATKNPL